MFKYLKLLGNKKKTKRIIFFLADEKIKKILELKKEKYTWALDDKIRDLKDELKKDLEEIEVECGSIKSFLIYRHGKRFYKKELLLYTNIYDYISLY